MRANLILALSAIHKISYMEVAMGFSQMVLDKL